jgi:hypothetical protein
MATSQPQTSLFTEGKSTSSQVDSRANRTAKPGNDLEKKMTATSGRRCLEQYGRFSRVGSWERMFSALLIGTGDWYSTKCKLTWKMKGTSYNRMYFQLVPSTHRTVATEFGLLPTVTAMDMNHGMATAKGEIVGNRVVRESGKDFSIKLSHLAQVGMLPTPGACDVEGAPKRPDMITQSPGGNWYRTSDTTGTKFGAKLQDVAQLLPTPTASDYHARGDQPGWDGSDLVSTMHKITEADGKTSQLNPRFVSEMMGFPPNWTELPFQSGDKNP